MENSTRFSIKKIVFVALFIVGMASLSELHAQCAISDISSSNESVCNDNGTPSNILDDTFTADISVTFSDAPLTGTLDLSGDGIASISVVGLVSPHTFIGVSLPANGRRQLPRRIRPLSLAQGCRCPARLAAGRNWLPDSRRRHAGAVADRVYAQPGAHDRGLVPDQAFVD